MSIENDTATALSELAAGASAPRRQTATVVGANQLSPTVRELTLEPEGDTFVEFLAGQWIALHLPVAEGQPRVVRDYSISNAPKADGSLTFCIERMHGGPAVGYLWHIEIGTGLQFTGPGGDFVLPASADPILMLAHGAGIAPFRAMLESLERGTAVARKVHLLHMASVEAELLYAYEFRERTGRVDWFTYTSLVGEDAAGLLAAQSAGLMDRMPFTPMVCGETVFVDAAVGLLTGTLGFETGDICAERYGG